VKILLTGADGQLGQALSASLPAEVELIATARKQLDLSDPQSCRSAVHAHRPDWVLNAGAYTAVDKAESEPEQAMAVNAGAPRAFAEALSVTGGRLLQISTDFVFNGCQGHPYEPVHSPDPLGVYGATKTAGEQAVDEILGCSDEGRATILRTGWVYGPVGQNFLFTMLRLHRLKAEVGESLNVVADQVGCPTSTSGLAAACWAVIKLQVMGMQHWSDAGVASWYDFAVAIGELAAARGLLSKAAQVLPITTADFPTQAKRPAYALLASSRTREQLQLRPQHWRSSLEEVINRVEA